MPPVDVREIQVLRDLRDDLMTFGRRLEQIGEPESMLERAVRSVD